LEQPQILSSQTLKEEPSSDATPISTPIAARTAATRVPGSGRSRPPKRKGRPPKIPVQQPKVVEGSQEKQDKPKETVDLTRDSDHTPQPKKRNTGSRFKVPLTPTRETRAMKRKLDEVLGDSRDGMGDFERMLLEG